MKKFVLFMVMMLMGSPTMAQTDPRTWPLFNPASVQFAGKIYVPPTDSKGMMLNYGAGAAGFSEDGTLMYVGCRQKLVGAVGQDGRGMFWTGTIPQIGGTSKEVAPCQGISPTALSTGLTGSPDCYFPLFGGVAQKGGKLIANGYCTYDATGSNPRKTWWTGTSFNQLSGPVEGSVKNGLVMQGIIHVPKEWQSLLGGDLAVTAGYTSIISRSSYGPSLTTLYAKDVGTTGFPMNLLLGCPSYDPATGAALPQCQSLWQHNSPPDLINYGGAEHSAGMVIPPGTRTLAMLYREAKGPMCYGYATRNAADHGKPYLDATYCYSLSDPLGQKGPMAYPYTFLGLLYDLNDLLAVKNGTKKPWDVKPYATFTMPTDSPNFAVGYTGSASYNHVTSTYYLFRELFPNGPNGEGEVSVFTGWGSPAPPEEICGDNIDNDGDGQVDEGCQEICGDGIDNNGNGQIDEGCAPPPPTGSFVATPKTCTLVMTLNVSTGSVQFQRRLTGATSWTNHGTKDSSGPYERSSTQPSGTYEAQAVWSGQPSPIPLGTQVCK